MSNQLHLKPVGDLKVIDPATGQRLPKEGKTVPATKYWYRRLADEEVELVTVTTKPKPSQEAS